LTQPLLGPLVVAGYVPAVQHQLFAHVLGEPRHLHGPSGPGDVGVSGQFLRRVCHSAEPSHPVAESGPQVGVVHRPKRRLTLFEASSGYGLAFQVTTEHPREFLGVAGLMDDDVADGPRLAPRSRVGAPPLDGFGEGRPFRKAVSVHIA
jgi:hypothetical protein